MGRFLLRFELIGLLLRHDEPVVNAFLFQQLLVRSDLGDAPFFDDDEPVGVPQRGKAVRDGDRRAVFHQTAERLLNFALRFGV